MGALRDLIQSNPDVWLAVGGLIIGTLFGYIVFRTNFCTMGSISDIMSFGDYRRFRSWILAAALTLVGAQLLNWAGVVPLAKSMYLSPTLNWFGNIVGGLIFGFGMVFAGGCASRNLTRVGAGDLRSLVTLIVMGLFAYMAIGGIIGPLRNWFDQVTSVNLSSLKVSTQSIGELVGVVTKLGPDTGNLVITVLIAGAAAIYCFKDANFRNSPIHILAGGGIALCAIAGWVLTGLAYDEMGGKPMTPISLTYVRPTADSLEWLQRFTATMVPGFGVASVFGAILGAFIAAKSMGRFKFTTFSNVADTKRVLFGAALMGIGGVMALGCTIGQAVTGVSTLAIGSFLTFAAIVAGGVLGMKKMETILMNEV
ncbi:MAG: YeeE/YedE family protein [Hyphomicrobiaceae bacterium]